jgi:hypothetical protein
LHATWQARQPMHFVMSMSVDLMDVGALAFSDAIASEAP